MHAEEKSMIVQVIELHITVQLYNMYVMFNSYSEL